MDDELKKLSSHIRQLRRSHQLSQKELAHIMGISVATLRKLEKGECPKRLGVSCLLRLCQYFAITPVDLFL